MFLNGKEYDIDIESDDTLKQVAEKIFDVTGGLIQAKVEDDGTFSIKAYSKEDDGEGHTTYTENESAKLSLGSSADESNLASALKMHTEIGTHGYQSNYALSNINTNIAMKNSASGLGELEFFDAEGNPADFGNVYIHSIGMYILLLCFL